MAALAAEEEGVGATPKEHFTDRSDRSGVYRIQHHMFEPDSEQDASRGAESKSHVLVVCCLNFTLSGKSLAKG